MGLISFSCTDLDEEIFSEITTDNYYQNSNNIYAALVNNYAKAFSTGWSDARYFLQEVTADQLMIPTRGKHGYNGGEYVRLHEHKWTVEENFVYNGWAAPFQGIALCNNTLSDFENLDFSTFKLTEETKNEYIAELRALRVWNYMFLIDFFRHVPIVTDIEEVKAQSTPLEVFNFMESELLAILPDLPKNRGVSRFDQAGVASILVRLYLNAEKWIGISKYDECEQMAQAILDGKYGEYLRYNNPHKLSLYIVAQIPIITWENAAISSFVKENKIGICINSLDEISLKIKSISDKEYDEFIKNEKKISEKMQKGYFLKKSIEKIN